MITSNPSPFRSIVQFILQSLLTLWSRLTDPLVPTANHAEYHEMKMLANLHLFQLIFLLTTVPFFWTAAQPERKMMVSFIVILLFIYLTGAAWLSRVKAHRIIAYLTPVSATLFWQITTVVVRDTAAYPYLLTFLLLPVLLGAMFLSLRWSVWITLANLLLLSINVFSLKTINPLQGITGIIIPFLTLSGLILLSKDYHHRVAQSRQMQLEKNERRLRTFFDEAHDWVFQLNASGAITYVNRRMCDDSGYTKAELIGHTPFAFLHATAAQAIAEPLQTILNGKTVEHVEVEVPQRNGQTIWLDVKGLIETENGAVSGTIHIARDITKLKQAEAELKNRHEQISGLYRQAQQEIEERRRAEQAEREQRLFAEGLVDTVNALHSTHDLMDLLRCLCVAIENVLTTDAISILLVDETGHARLVYEHGLYGAGSRPNSHSHAPFYVAETPNMAAMVATLQPVFIPDVHMEPSWIRRPESSWIRCIISAPIVSAGTVLGFLSIESATPGYFSDRDKDKVQVFAQQVAQALVNARMYEDLAVANEHLEQAVQARTAELERSNEQVAAILQNSPDGVTLLDANGVIETVNPAFQRLFPAAKQVSGLPLSALFDSDTRVTAAVAETLHNGRFSRLEMPITQTHSKPIDIDMALAPVYKQHDIVGAVCSLRDISALKEVARMKDQFISNISHELRTPLTNLRLHHDLIVHNPAKQDVYLERINREINRLYYVIESMLRLSHLDRKGRVLKLAAVNLKELVSQSVSDRLPLIEQNALTVSCDLEYEMPPVMLDAGLIEQVLSILLTNAINFTPPGGHISVKLLAQTENGRSLVGFKMADTGPGIPQAEQAMIFDRFFRGSSGQSSGIPGTGLGLAIAHEIVSLHQGEITVYSSGIAGEGTAFSVWLPATPQV